MRRFCEHTIHDDRDFAAHVDYIHYNPVKHGLVGRMRDWPYSSFHLNVRRGLCERKLGPATPANPASASANRERLRNLRSPH